MATSRSSMPKEMTPFGKAASKSKGNPFGAKKAKPFGFAEGGAVAPPNSPTVFERKVKPTGGGQMRGGGAATKGKKFQGTF